jgi:hypothetical protein
VRALLFQHFPNRKVLVLREDDRARLDGSIPNGAVICALEAEIEDVCGEMSPAIQPLRQRWRQLSIDQELHQVPRSTGWSLCVAANCRDATMSPT